MSKISLHDALNQVEEERWQCETCSSVREEGERYCQNCKSYWDDYVNSLWDRLED